MSAQQPETAIKAISTAKLTFNYIQKMERQKYRALGILLFLVTISFIWLLFQSENGYDQTELAVFPHAMFILTSFIGAYWCLRVAYRGYQGGSLLLTRRHCLSWLLIGLGLIMNGFGASVKGASLLFFHTILLVPSLADLYYQVFSCLFLLGL